MRPTFSTIALSLTLALASSMFVRATGPEPQAARSSERIKRGEYLVAITGCHDCHSPKVDA